MDDLSHLTPTHTLLKRLLAGEVPTLEMLQELLDKRIEEDLHLDYKGKDVLTKDPGQAKPGFPKDYAGKLRKHVAGFANGDGGVLIIGVGELPK